MVHYHIRSGVCFGEIHLKKSEMQATIDLLIQENQQLKEQLIKYKRSECIGDDR